MRSFRGLCSASWKLIVVALMISGAPRASAAAPSATAPSTAAPPTAISPATLENLTFLVGRWDASGGGQPGQGTGTTTFEPGLQHHVLIRHNVAEYPASAAAPASRHDDLMVIYEGTGGTLGADYYDSEGHRIHYSVEIPEPGRAVFLSDSVPGVPRFRLTYHLDEAGHLAGQFEIAPPGKSEFGPYLAWDSVRANAP